MLSMEDLALARELMEKVREIAAPRARPFVKPGELGAPDLLNCSRTSAWMHTKDPTFPAPIVLGPKTRMWKREEVVRWRDSHQAQKAESPAGFSNTPRALASDLTEIPRRKRGRKLDDTDGHNTPTRRRCTRRAR